MICGTCGRAGADYDARLASEGDYQVITLGTAAASGAVSRRRVELGRSWRAFTVLSIPDVARSSPLYLHLGESDPGIRLLHRGQRIHVPPGVASGLVAEGRLYWSGDELDGWPADLQLFASDVVALEIQPPGPTSEDVVEATISGNGNTSLGASDPASVSRWAVHITVSGGFDGSIDFLGRVHPADGTLVTLHYINVSTGTVATAAITADAIVLLEATGLGDVLVRCQGLGTGTATIRARPVRG